MNEELKNHIKDKIRQLRMNSGYLQKDFADLIGVSQNTMNRLENGHRVPDMELLATIRQHFKVDINELVDPQYDQHAQATTMVSIPVFDDLQLSLPETQRRAVSHVIYPGIDGVVTGDLVGVVAGPVTLGDLVLMHNSSGIIEARRMGSLATGKILVADNQDYMPISDFSDQAILGKVGFVIKVQRY